MVVLFFFSSCNSFRRTALSAAALIHDVLYVILGLSSLSTDMYGCITCVLWIFRLIPALHCADKHYENKYVSNGASPIFNEPFFLSFPTPFLPEISPLFRFIHLAFSLLSNFFPTFLLYLHLSISVPFSQLLLVSFACSQLEVHHLSIFVSVRFSTKQGEKKGEIKVTTPHRPPCRSKQALSVIVQ